MPSPVAPKKRGSPAFVPDAPDSVLEPVARSPVTHWPGSFWLDPGNSTCVRAVARALLSLVTLWSAVGTTALRMGIIFFFLHAFDRVADLLDAAVQAQTGCLQWRTPIVRQ